MINLNNRQKYLIIDGDYMGNRCIFNLVKNMPNFTIADSSETEIFKEALYNDFIGIVTKFQKFIDDVVIVFDSTSWRKSLTPPIPYYIDKNASDFNVSDFKYKQNRSKTKEESPINWLNFKHTLNLFGEELKNNFKVFKVSDTEGDDLIWFLSTVNSDKNFNIIYATDGDLKQLISENTIYFRNINSKVSPSGEFVIHQSHYDYLKAYGERESIDILLNGGDFTKDYFDNLFIFDNVKRELDISVVKQDNVIDLIAEKVISGDKKDNILPIIRWSSTTGTRNYGPTLKHINNVWNSCFIENDKDKYDVLTDKHENIKLKQFISMLAIETKQIDIIRENKENIERLFETYNYNLKCNVLSEEFIPKEIVDKIKENYELIYNKKVNLLELINTYKKQLSTGSTPNSKDDIFFNSIDI